MTDAKFLALMIFATFFLVFSFVPGASAVGGTISDQASCQAVGGSWIAPNQCLISSLFLVNPGETLTIAPGIILVNEGHIDNGGTINNSGTINNFNLISNSGTINNFNLISNFGTINNSGTILVFGTINNFGTVNNSGTLRNGNESGSINNAGTLVNRGVLANYSGGGGNINNNSGSTIDNFGTIQSFGGNFQNNPGATINNNSGGSIQVTVLRNSGNINNNSGASLIVSTAMLNPGIINNQCGANMSNSGVFSDNPVNEILCTPNLISPADGSTVDEPKPDLTWDANGETRPVTYSASLEDTSNPRIPIELVSLSLVSAEPLNDLPGGNYEWSVSSTLDPSYSPGYPFASTPVNSVISSFTVEIADTTPPVITILGDNPATHEAVTPYVDTGATALDDVDGDLTSAIIVTNNVDENTVGQYTVEYLVTDSSRNTASAQRTVNVIDTTPPVVTVPSDITAEATGPVGATVTFVASATDTVDGELVSICDPASGSTFALGDTTVTCTATDSAGNEGSASFTVSIQDTTPPTITILGDNPATILQNLIYVDAGATASDIVDGDLTSSIIVNNPVDTSFPDTYTVTYTVSDGAGNTAEATRTVVVKSATDAIQDLINQVGSLGLQKGTENSLTSNLDTAISRLSDNNPNNDSAACGILGSFVNKVQAQSGKKIDSDDADALIASAEQIRTAIDC